MSPLKFLICSVGVAEDCSLLGKSVGASSIVFGGTVPPCVEGEYVGMEVSTDGSLFPLEFCRDACTFESPVELGSSRLRPNAMRATLMSIPAK